MPSVCDFDVSRIQLSERVVHRRSARELIESEWDPVPLFKPVVKEPHPIVVTECGKHIISRKLDPRRRIEFKSACNSLGPWVERRKMEGTERPSAHGPRSTIAREMPLMEIPICNIDARVSDNGIWEECGHEI